MRIIARDFGPLHNIDIELKPMTVVIGKNNLGKTFLAQLIYVVLNTLRDVPARATYYRWIALDDRDSNITNLKKIVSRIKKEHASEIQIVDEVARIALSKNEEILGEMIRQGIARAFGPDIRRLINITARSATVCCDAFKNVNLTIVLTRRETIKVSLQISKEVVESLSLKHADTIGKILQKRQKMRYIEVLLYELLR